jgi:hypothetical protein
VTFRACEDEDTEFLGGIVVAGARCVPLRIAEPGRPPRRQLLSFGAGECVTSTDTRDGERPSAWARRVLRRAPCLVPSAVVLAGCDVQTSRSPDDVTSRDRTAYWSAEWDHTQ